MADMSKSAAREWRAGWPLIGAALIIYWISTIHGYTLGVFIKPLEQEFGWTRGQVVSGLTIWSIVNGVFAPVMGLMLDRFGARWIAIIGVALYSLLVCLLALATSDVTMWRLSWALIAAGSLCISPTILSFAVASRFVTARGFALAVMLCGASLGSALNPIIASSLIEAIGWRQAYVVLGLVPAAIGVAIGLPFFRDAWALRQRHPTRDSAPAAPVAGVSIRQGLTSRAFMLLLMTALIITCCNTGLLTQLVPLLEESGVPARIAASVAGIAGVMSVVGRLITGSLLDRVDARYVAAAAFCGPMLAAAILLYASGSAAGGIAAAMLVGLALGAEIDVLVYLSTKHFGLRHFGVLFGAISAMYSFGWGLGPLYAAKVFDATGSYTLVFWTIIPAVALALLFVLAIGPYPRLPQPDAGDPVPQPI